MLRASIESVGGKVDFSGLVDASMAEASSIRGAGALVGFVDASLSACAGPSGPPSAISEATTAALAKARDRVRAELGAAALVDAAAIIGNFERMVRIADGTGIPLDAPVNVATESIRAELGIDRFESAARTSGVRGWQRALGRLLDPLSKIVLRWWGRASEKRG